MSRTSSLNRIYHSQILRAPRLTDAFQGWNGAGEEFRFRMESSHRRRSWTNFHILHIISQSRPHYRRRCRCWVTETSIINHCKENKKVNWWILGLDLSINEPIFLIYANHCLYSLCSTVVDNDPVAVASDWNVAAHVEEANKQNAVEYFFSNHRGTFQSGDSAENGHWM
jgi:hypothetical protein